MAKQAQRRSRLKNVFWYQPRKCWIVKLRIRHYGKGYLNIGYFPPEEELEAGKVADLATRLARGPNAGEYLNFYPYRMPRTWSEDRVRQRLTAQGVTHPFPLIWD